MSWKDILKEELHPAIRWMANGDSSIISGDFAIKRMCRAGKEHLSKGLYNLNLTKEEILHAYILQRVGKHEWEDEFAGPAATTDKLEKNAKAIKAIITESKRVCSNAKQEQKELDDTIRSRFPNWREDETEDEYMERTGDMGPLFG
jgi:hypothetical protein